MSIKVLEASAGSGKTYQLSMFYVKLALENPNNFKKILAITFTNAAVNEMKLRILDRLYSIANNNPNSLEEFKAFAKGGQINGKNITQLSDDDISGAAKNVLYNILHNYQDFSVSTIDSFLQRLFRGALYEIGVKYNYELIVKNDDIYREAVDDFIVNLQEQYPAFNWLIKFIEDKLAQDKSFNYNNMLLDLIKEINKEFFYDYEDVFNKLTDEDFKQKCLDDIIKCLDYIMNDFLGKAKKINDDFNKVLKETGYEEENFAYKGDGSVKYIGSKLENAIKIKDSFKGIMPKNRFVDIMNQKQGLLKKDSHINIPQQNINDILTLMKNYYDLIFDINNEFTIEYRNYETARIISNQIYNIALLSDILKSLYDYKKTNNILLLSDIGKMLRKFIENNYMFIYEKLGVYYEYFLIDEFQDTSHVQYEIIKPLINESLSQAQSDNVLLVGDIKQAIYRWRNGDWEIMKDTIDTDFHNSISRNNLTENWRSYPNIVNFNNSLFSELLSLKDLFNEENIVKLDYIKEIYIDPQKNRDVKQEIPDAKKDQFKDFQGYVKLYIAKDKNNKNTATNDVNSTADDTSDSIESEEDDKVLQLVINDVNNLWEKGYKNIGILVRTNKEAVEVFKYILQNSEIQDNDFKIISDESISFANSDAVLWIVFTLYALQNGSNYARYMSEAFYDFIKTSNSVPYKSLMDNLENDNNFMAQNLYFKAEHLVNIIYKELDDKEKVFCMHFLQLIKNYQREHNNNEVMFINWFLNNGVQQSLTITEEKNGVHISTIHKSKGLEYDAVIVPFINWTRNQNDYLWFKKPDICNSNIPAFLLKTSGDLANSQFADEYYMEKTKKYVDDLNLLYVALTRAKKVLIANIENQNIGKEIQKCVTNNFNIDGLGAIDTYKSINSNENFDIYEIGTLVNNTTYASDVSIENFQWAAKENVGIEIKIKKNYSLSSNEKIAHGVLMHDILRVIDDVDNWEKKADKILKKYHKTSEEIEKIKDNIKTIFEINQEVKNWFTNAQEIISERDLAIYKLESDKERKMYRPDKIFIYPDKVIVVDFKTGEKDLNEYKYQVRNYIEILRQIFDKDIEGFLLNIDNNELINVEI